jgi:FtsX-like permease family
LWAASQLRRGSAALVLLGLLAGLAAGVITAAVAGAERSASAYPRMRMQLRAADAVFFPSQVGIGNADVTKLSSIPEVAAWSGFALLPGWFDELGPNAGPFVTVGDGWFTTVERAKILAGRLPDPTRDDEAVVNEPAVGKGARLGMTLTFRTYTPADYERFGDEITPRPEQLHGPVVKMRIVGIIRMPIDSVLTFATEPEIYTSPGWYATHEEQAAIYFTNAFVRLKRGAADLPAFQTHVAQVYGRSDIPIKDLSDDVKRVQNSTNVERTALLLFAGCALLASLVLVGQAFVRAIQAESDTVPTLNAMGLGPRALATGLALPHVVTLAVAGVVAVLTTFVLSARFPIGLARRLDPELGYHVQPVYLLVGAAAALVVTSAMAVGAAVLTTRAALGRGRAHRTRVVGAVTRTGAPVPAAVGASLALEHTGGQGSVPVRPALAAATAAILGVVGAFTLVGGINDALADPARSGRNWKLEAEVGRADQVTKVTEVPGVGNAGIVSRFAGTVHDKDVPFYALDNLKGSTHFAVLTGRSPEQDDETMLGARSAKVLNLKTGDTIRADTGGPLLHVVGIGLLLQTPHTTFDEGALVTMTTLDAISTTKADQREAFFLISPDRATKVTTLQANLQQAGIETAPPDPIADLENLADVRSLPYLLAGFLVVLGLGAVGHALLTVSRRRVKELAVLRAVGLTPRQTAACVTWQATVVALIALVIGIPLGLVVGRQVWRTVAASVPLVYVGPLSPTLLAVVIVGALAALLLLAAVPALRAARLPTAAALRAE